MPDATPAPPAGRAPDADEERWLQLARQGDDQAFGQLMRAHHDAIFRRVVSIVRNEQDAKDLSQDIWIAVWKQLPSFRGDSRFSTWLFTLATRRALDHLRRRRRWLDRFLSFTRPSTHPGEAEQTWEPADETPGALAKLEHLERRQLLERALQALSPDLRAVLALRDVEGLAYSEIATTLDWPIGTVMSRLHHARRRLTLILKDFPCD
ncbi:MAG: sigma-70 family RNA polymerase sigma factor [Opitutaceae bacterium]|jgi:RNA polymerase sigma-70 factor (ECF subfamily)|nr:sigma-70 family RNA polymerase sigma factor [Opitutaceae bacterium]